MREETPDHLMESSGFKRQNSNKRQQQSLALIGRSTSSILDNIYAAGPEIQITKILDADDGKAEKYKKSVTTVGIKFGVRANGSKKLTRGPSN